MPVQASDPFDSTEPLSASGTALTETDLREEDQEPREENTMGSRRLLLVTVTKGYRHQDSIPLIETIVPELGKQKNAFSVDFVRNDEEMASKMTPEALRSVDAVFFGNTTGDLPLPDREGFLRWLEGGRAFIGVHSASDTFHSYPPYIQMIGGEFLTHGEQSKVRILRGDTAHPATRMFDTPFEVFDEIYQFKSYNPEAFHDLLHLDRHPNSREPGYYPIAWCKRYGRGRVFYTALGHRPDVWQAGWFQQHLLGGIRWALGLEKGDDRPQLRPS